MTTAYLKRLLISLMLLSTVTTVAAKTPLRLGVLMTGTLGWEIPALQQLHLTNVDIVVHPLAQPEAGKIALQSGAVDMIVTDWIWVARLRATGSDLTFYPYSQASGALLVPEKSAIHELADLTGKRLGIVGGDLDKNWLLLQALGLQAKINLADSVEKTFAAPPLLNEQLKKNRLDALLTYWNFAVPLELAGYRQLIDGQGIQQKLGITEAVPTLGFVFKDAFANKHPEAIQEFFAASSKVKQQLCTSDTDWQHALPVIKVTNSQELILLRQRYCQGQITQWGAAEKASAQRMFTLLRTLSQQHLTGASETIPAGTFWAQEN
ncbi:MAG: ABC transporter substrate-binding protein [Methylovulum sp.]|nr:ABC transporter substrate-binding protein [Methylovulum sp.]